MMPSNYAGSGRFIVSILVCLSFTSPALPAQWTSDSTIDLGIIYTDNLTLASAGLEEGETIFAVVPDINLSTDGDRLVADLRYRPEAFFYSNNSEANEIYHTIDSSLTAAFVRDALFIYASAVKFQSILSPDARFSLNNVPISSNRVESTIFEVRPYWEQDLGFAEVLAELAYVDTSYGNVADPTDFFTQDNNERRAIFNLNNHSEGRGIAWGVDYEFRRLEYDLITPWEYQRATANLGYWINGTTRIFGTGGAETPFDNYLDPAMDAGLWEVGFQLKPNQRIDFEVAAGERSYGSTIRGRLSYEHRRGETNISYSERPSTRGELGFDRRPISQSDILNGFVDRPGESDRFIRKRGEWSTTIELSKSDWYFQIFSEERTERTTALGVPLDDERFSGAAFRLSWRLGPKSSAGVGADIARRDDSLGDGTLNRLMIDYQQKLTQRISIVLSAIRAEQDYEDTAVGRYVEHQLQLFMRTSY